MQIQFLVWLNLKVDYSAWEHHGDAIGGVLNLFRRVYYLFFIFVLLFPFFCLSLWKRTWRRSLGEWVVLQIVMVCINIDFTGSLNLFLTRSDLFFRGLLFNKVFGLNNLLICIMFTVRLCGFLDHNLGLHRIVDFWQMIKYWCGVVGPNGLICLLRKHNFEFNR